MAHDLDLQASLPSLTRQVKDLVQEMHGRQQVLQYRFGFYRLPLYADRKQDGQALHVWLDELPADEYPHTHIFKLTSRILLGRMRNSNWGVAETPDGNYRLVTPHSTGTLCEDRPSDRFCKTEPFVEQDLGPGALYHVAKGIFHTTTILEYPVVTLIHRGDVEADAQPSHLAPRRETGARKFDVGEVNQDVAWAKIHTAIQRMPSW